MIGRVVTNEVKLDYCQVAEPLDTEQINADINDVRAASHFWAPPASGLVSEIVMWEHQWDWITKAMQAKQYSVPILFGAPTMKNTLFGIPVRLA